MSEDSKIRCGVVGTGYLGQHHARIYAALDGCELTGIVESDDARADEIRGKYGCARYDSPEALAADCDAVSVVVPTDLHCQVALPLLEGGCHLLIEKPLCTSLAEAEQILAAAKKGGCIVQVGHIEHYNPVMGYLENAVTQPRYITADRLAPFNPRGTEVGVVLDLMIHDIGIILALVRSPVERVDAVGVKVLSPSEDIANARIVFENGCVANINTSRVSQKKVREIRVFQPANYLSLDFMEQKGHFLRKEGPELVREEIPIEKDEPLKLELESFTQVVREAGSPKVGAELGKSALELAIQITELIDA
ncbi:MAG: Gfo/Idh/MocA family protein [Opitutales bacterium]